MAGDMKPLPSNEGTNLCISPTVVMMLKYRVAINTAQLPDTMIGEKSDSGSEPGSVIDSASNDGFSHSSFSDFLPSQAVGEELSDDSVKALPRLSFLTARSPLPHEALGEESDSNEEEHRDGEEIRWDNSTHVQRQRVPHRGCAA